MIKTKSSENLFIKLVLGYFSSNIAAKNAKQFHCLRLAGISHQSELRRLFNDFQLQQSSQEVSTPSDQLIYVSFMYLASISVTSNNKERELYRYSPKPKNISGPCMNQVIWGEKAAIGQRQVKDTVF